jgi:hypothetical protein
VAKVGLLRCVCTSALGGEASRLLSSKANAATVWVVYQKGMPKTLLVAGCVLLFCSTVSAGDDVANWPRVVAPQQDLIENVKEVLRETELQSCEQQQQEALQRFLSVGVPYSAAVLMAQNQYPCDGSDL